MVLRFLKKASEPVVERKASAAGRVAVWGMAGRAAW